jgi:hypothetical protein
VTWWVLSLCQHSHLLLTKVFNFLWELFLPSKFSWCRSVAVVGLEPVGPFTALSLSLSRLLIITNASVCFHGVWAEWYCVVVVFLVKCLLWYFWILLYCTRLLPFSMSTGTVCLYLYASFFVFSIWYMKYLFVLIDRLIQVKCFVSEFNSFLWAVTIAYYRNTRQSFTPGEAKCINRALVCLVLLSSIYLIYVYIHTHRCSVKYYWLNHHLLHASV